MITKASNPIKNRKNNISIGWKSANNTFVEMKVVPQIMTVSNAAKCPFAVLFSMLLTFRSVIFHKDFPIRTGS